MISDDGSLSQQSIGRVVVHALGRVQRFDEARAHEVDKQLRVVLLDRRSPA